MWLQEDEGEGSDIEDMDLGDGEDDDIPGADANSRGFRAMQERLQKQPRDAAAAEAVQRGTAEIQRLMEQYDALDYEDHVGGVATKFRWACCPGMWHLQGLAHLLPVDLQGCSKIVPTERRDGMPSILMPLLPELLRTTDSCMHDTLLLGDA